MPSNVSRPAAAMPQPTQQSSVPNQHPRRMPAHKSVSLLHPRRRLSSNQNSDSSGNSQRNQPSDSTGSPSSLRPAGQSSGESSNADKWFDKSNNEVRDNSASFADDEPPFFMRNSSSSETPPDARQLRQQLSGSGGGADSLPMRADMLRIGTDGSSTEDFRGVIDDLTIENKKLKRRLKRYEKLHDSHLKDEKLFEVRVHGLPPAKKRELEETLRNFAASMSNVGFPADGYETLMANLKGASSQTSFQNTDSAYASMSASGPGSSAQSGTDRVQRQPGQTPTSRRQNIHSFLHHIPENLLPQRNPAAMSERSKKRMVIRRLEQIFTGKGAAVGRHHHPLQQQEVSRLAARQDRSAADALGQLHRTEGNREACILRQSEESEDPTHHSGKSPENDGNTQMMSEGVEKDSSSRTEQEMQEQRPTRPLDLDPHRAQVAAENIQYIRHLGFSPPDPYSEAPPQDNHGWIYLNLLTNMAQLHTINVTADFVRKALTEYPSKFELSNDERKVRWVGGRRGDTSARSTGASSASRTDIDTPDGESPKKRPKLHGRQSGYSNGSGKSQQNNNKLLYTPLFFHRSSSDDTDDSSSEDDANSTFSQAPVLAPGDSSAMTSSGMHTTTTNKKRKTRDDGPMIFYKSAGFITDLSGEPTLEGNHNAARYEPASAMPLGMRQPATVAFSETKGPLAQAAELPEPMDLTDNPIPESMELSFPPSSSPKSQSHHSDASEMEVSGIGGVWPSDNFAIAVQSRSARVNRKPEPITAQAANRKLMPSRLANILHGPASGRMARPAVHEHQVISSQRKDLPPSQLPPALNLMPDDEDSEDDESANGGDDDEMAWAPQLSDGYAPSAAPQPVELPYASSDEEDDDDMEDDDDDDESEGSLDLLAAVRQFDPEAIRLKEREYDANMAERLAEEIPAGSSAATAGGGSGFASPAGSNVDAQEHRRATRRARRQASLKLARDSGSMIVQDPRQARASSDEDNVQDGAQS